MGRSRRCRKVKQRCTHRRGFFSSLLAFFDRPKKCSRCTCNSKWKRNSHCCQSSPCCSRFQYSTPHTRCPDISYYPPQGCPPPSGCC